MRIENTVTVRAPSLTADLDAARRPDVQTLSTPELSADSFVRAGGMERFPQVQTRPADLEKLKQLAASIDSQAAPKPSTTSANGAGYSARASGGNVMATQRAALGDLQRVHLSLAQVRDQYRSWKAENPTAKEPTDGKYTMGQIVDGGMSDQDQCLHLIMMILNERPETTGELTAGIPANELPQQSQPAAGAPAGQDPLAGLLQMLGPIAQVVGPIASILGPILGSGAATPLLMGAALLIPPPAGEAVAAAIPVIVPIAAIALSAGGAVATTMGGAAASGAPQGAPGGGPDLGAVASGVGGMLSAVAPLAQAAGPLLAAI